MHACETTEPTGHDARNPVREGGNVLVLFDFDKTLVTVDSFRFFVRVCAGSPANHLRMIASTPLCRVGVISNSQYKQYLLRHVWCSRTPEVQASLLERFCEKIRQRQNAMVVRRMLDHVGAGHAVAVLSASPQFYLEPAVHELSPRVEVYGSQVTCKGPVVEMVNLHGRRKAELARSLIRDRKPDRVHVYTDHQSDLPLLRLADSATLVRPARRLLREVRRLQLEYETI